VLSAGIMVARRCSDGSDWGAGFFNNEIHETLLLGSNRQAAKSAKQKRKHSI